MTQENKHPISTEAPSENPYEKLRGQGPDYCSDLELLHLLLQFGKDGPPPHQACRSLLERCQFNLRELGKLSLMEIQRMPGMTARRAASLIAALELSRRREQSRYLERHQINSSSQMASYLQARLRDLQHEVFAVVYLNRSHRILRLDIVSQGGITGTVADPRIILKKALEETAVAIILCHNHPSGSLQPSRADEELTYKIRDAARYLDIQVLDHIIVSEMGYFSFADQGLL